jgi:hypothetical protein
MATANPATAIPKKVDVSTNDGKTFSEKVFFLELWSIGNTASQKTIDVKGEGQKFGPFKQIQFRFDKDRNYIYTKSDVNQRFDETYAGTASEYSISGLSAGSAKTVIRVGRTNSTDDIAEQYNGPAERVEVKVETATIVGSDKVIKDDKPGEVLPLNADGTVTLPGGQTSVPVKNNELVEAVYGNQIVRSDEGGTFEATAPKGRANSIVQGYIVLPSGIIGMKHGKDEGTIILKDNHGPGGDMNRQYKAQFVYEKGGAVNGIQIHREHEHPTTTELKKVKYATEPKFEAGEKIEFKASYQDTNDDGVRLRMDYKDPKTGKWEKLFDHVDYGDGDKEQCYRGKSGVQDGTRVDGRVGGGKPSGDDEDKYRKIRNKPIRTTELSDDLKKILSKLATTAVWAREIEPDKTDLKDGKDDPLSFGPK